MSENVPLSDARWMRADTIFANRSNFGRAQRKRAFGDLADFPNARLLPDEFDSNYWPDELDFCGENDTARWNPPMRLVAGVEVPVEDVP
jgi:hypothetical protein